MADRVKTIERLAERIVTCQQFGGSDITIGWRLADDILALLKEQKVDTSKYQYKHDHTDCIWYRDSRSKCPVTCSQYRDGWNDAMDFVFKNGAGYSPYKRR